MRILHVAAGRRLFDGSGDDVTDSGILALGPPGNVDTSDLLRAGVVRNLKDRLHLDHALDSPTERLFALDGLGS